MEIDLPVHQPACDKEFLYGVDSFDLHDEAVVPYVEHLQEPFARHTPLLHTREEGVAAEVVHPVHVQLAGDELVEEMLVVLILEDRNRHVERSLFVARLAEVGVDTLHHKERYIFVGNAIDEGVFEDMGERSVADVMEEDRNHSGSCFFVRYFNPFEPQRSNCFLHEMHRSERVPETTVHRTRIDQIREP